MDDNKGAYATIDVEDIFARQTPSAPPPPPDWRPPPYSERIYEAFEPQEKHRWVFRLALLELVLGLVVLGVGVTCTQFGTYCPYYTGVWTGGLFLLNAITGILAARTHSQNMFIAHLLLSTLCLLAAVASFGVSYFLNFEPIGTDKHPSWHENYCVIFEHDLSRVDTIWRHKAEYDYGQCVMQLKYGIAFHACNMIFAVIMVLCNFCSMCLCCCRTCICARPCFVKP